MINVMQALLAIVVILGPLFIIWSKIKAVAEFFEPFVGRFAPYPFSAALYFSALFGLQHSPLFT